MSEITEARDKLTEAHSILLGNHPRSEVALLLLDVVIILDALAQAAEQQPVAWLSEYGKAQLAAGRSTAVLPQQDRDDFQFPLYTRPSPPSEAVEARRLALEDEFNEDGSPTYATVTDRVRALTQKDKAHE